MRPRQKQEDKALVGIDIWQKQALLLDHFPCHFAAGVQVYFIAHLDVLTIFVCEKIANTFQYRAYLLTMMWRGEHSIKP